MVAQASRLCHIEQAESCFTIFSAATFVASI